MYYCVVMSVLDLTAIEVTNIFDELPALSAPKPTELRNEISRYLSTDPEQVKDVLLWWQEHNVKDWVSFKVSQITRI